jgi:hypothetical protein
MVRRILCGLIVALTLYPMSIGPLYAYYNHQSEPMSPMMGRVISKVYKPLFHYFPETTASYLNAWNVSDIEAYFMTNLPQNGPENIPSSID